MKRLHIHMGVENLESSIRFYSALFAAQPVKTKSDYAKWMLEDPRINFAISTHPTKQGVDHLGLQVDEDQELLSLRAQFRQAEMATFDEGEAVCCYARSDKSWLQDPSGVAWEVYKHMEDAQVYSGQSHAGEDACCFAGPGAPAANTKGAEKSAGCCN